MHLFYPPLSVALPSLHLLTRFPSLLPPPSVSQRRRDKIRALTLFFLFTLVPRALLCPVVSFFFFLHLCSAGNMEFNGSLCDVSGALDVQTGAENV